MRMLSAGSRSQIGRRRPQISVIFEVVNSGTASTSACQSCSNIAVVDFFPVRLRELAESRRGFRFAMGRSSFTRRIGTPSSSMKAGAFTISAARLEVLFQHSVAPSLFPRKWI